MKINKIGSSSSIKTAKAIINKFKTDINNFECEIEFCSTKIDWGAKKKGQGKRNGHMVTGAMSDAPNGIKTYYGISLSEYIKDDPDNNLKLLRETPKRIAYVRARQFGCNHIEAMIYALKY